MNALQNFKLPTSRDENWKYANLKPLEKVQFAAAAQAGAVAASALPAEIQGYTRYTFVDGLFEPQLSTGNAQPGAAFSVIPAHVGLQSDKAGDMRFALLNEAHATNGARIAVATGTACIELVFVA